MDYRDFVELSQSGDSEARGAAARLIAFAYVSHEGPADERAALYAALMGFLEDPSVKVRAALAYGLLRSTEAPRAIMVALLDDAPVIVRAVVQYSPVLLDADLIGLIADADEPLLAAMAARAKVSARLAGALLDRAGPEVRLKLLGRGEVPVDGERLQTIARREGTDARMRGVLLARGDLPATARLDLIEAAKADLLSARIVKGAIAPRRLARILRDASDAGLSALGEREAAGGERGFAQALVAGDRVTTRLMLHALVHGHSLFFADCLAQLTGVSSRKACVLLERGGRSALNALLARAGFSPVVRNVLARLVLLARETAMADDAGARHLVLTILIEQLVHEHDGQIPADLEEAFGYLNAQNAALARQASQGVVEAFAETSDGRGLPALPPDDVPMALPAA